MYNLNIIKLKKIRRVQTLYNIKLHFTIKFAADNKQRSHYSYTGVNLRIWQLYISQGTIQEVAKDKV